MNEDPPHAREDDDELIGGDLRDDATLPASGDTIEEIRAEAARIRGHASFDPSEDPTNVMAERTEPSSQPEMPDQPAAFDSFDAENDPTTPAARSALSSQELGTPAQPATKQRRSGRKVSKPSVPAGSSLIEGKTPPVSHANYWDRGEPGTAPSPAAASGKGPIPKWFIATSVLAILMAIGLVLLVLWAVA